MKFFIFLSFFSFAAFISFCQKNDSTLELSEKKITDTIPYATLYFYRSYIPKINAPVKKIPIYINDSLLFQLKANQIIPVQVFKEGKYKIAIDTKGESDIPVKIKFGQEYFFKCAIEKGLWFGKPTIETISPKEGKIDAGMIKEE